MFDVFKRISFLQGNIVERMKEKRTARTIPFFFSLFSKEEKKKNEINLKIELVTREYEIVRQKREEEKNDV